MSKETMSSNEAIEMMKRASAEIRTLRRAVDELRPRAEANESIRIVLGLLPRPSQGYGEDVAWMLDKRIDELKAAMLKPSNGEGSEA